MEKIWANSGDSHLVEPDDLFTKACRPRWRSGCRAASRTRTAAGRPSMSTVSSFAAACPGRAGSSPTSRGAPCPSGRREPTTRRCDCLISTKKGSGPSSSTRPSGIWTSSIRDPGLARRGPGHQRLGHRVPADFSPRYVCAAIIPFLSGRVGGGRGRAGRRAGFHAASIPVKPLIDGDDWHRESWEPMWAALEETGLVVSYHIGSEPHEASETQRALLPRAGRSAAQLHGDHLRRPAGGLEDDRQWGIRPAPVASGHRLRGRRHLGPVRCRPAGRGISPACSDGPPAPQPAAERVPV